VVKLESTKWIVKIAARWVIVNGSEAEDAPKSVVVGQRDGPLRLLGKRF